MNRIAGFARDGQHSLSSVVLHGLKLSYRDLMGWPSA